MTPFDEQVICATMTRVQAWEKLCDPEYSGKLRMNDFYDLLVEAGYSEDDAQRAANQRGNDRLSIGEDA